jgi:hypothetical protein
MHGTIKTKTQGQEFATHPLRGMLQRSNNNKYANVGREIMQMIWILWKVNT